jgi:hypothetical protein
VLSLGEVSEPLGFLPLYTGHNSNPHNYPSVSGSDIT